MLKTLSHAKLGALWGAGLFLGLWLGMLGTIGEVLLILPGLWILGLLGVVYPGESTIWRGVAGVILTLVSAFIGARCGATVYSVFRKQSTITRIISLVFLAVTIVMIILIGRHLKM